jgi:hypothetical protein
MSFLVNNLEYFTFNFSVQELNTRRTVQQQKPSANLASYQRGVYYSNIKTCKALLIKKVKVTPLQAYGAQRVLGRLRLPDSVTSALEGGRLSAIRTGRLYPQEYPGTDFKRLSRPWAHGIVRCHGKNPQ